MPCRRLVAAYSGAVLARELAAVAREATELHRLAVEVVAESRTLPDERVEEMRARADELAEYTANGRASLESLRLFIAEG